jgi:hypothetical protein
MIVKRESLPHHVSVTCVFFLPETVAEQYRSRTSPLIVGCRERTAEQGVQAERLEKLSRCVITERVASFAARCQVKTLPSIREDAGKNILAVAHLLPDRIGEIGLSAHGHLEQLLRMTHRERLENHRTD